MLVWILKRISRLDMRLSNLVNNGVKYVPSWPFYIILPVPGIWTFYKAATNQLGADPLKVLEHQLGVYALQLLIAALLVTPLRNWLGVNFVKYRRVIGLMAFFYVCAHFLTYLWLDQQWWWDAIIKDLTKRPYIIIGMTAFLAMVPLAVTSNNISIRKMGPISWRRLHRLAHFCAIAGAIHYVLLEKTWQLEPVIYLVIAMFLLWYHISRLRNR